MNLAELVANMEKGAGINQSNWATKTQQRNQYHIVFHFYSTYVTFSESPYLACILQIQTVKSVSSPVPEFQLYFSCSICGWNSCVVALFFRFLNIWNIAENRNSCFPMLLKVFFKKIT